MHLYSVRRLSFLLFVCLVPALLLAQTNRGRIGGQVTDSSGGAIPGAKVIIENLGTHVQTVLETNSDGNYVDPNVEPGVYSVRAEAAKFRSVLRDHVQVEVANDIKIDFQLVPGAITEVVEVNELAPLTETSNAVLSGVLSNQAISELPMQGRDFQNLLPLHPGVQREPGGGFPYVTSNGMRPDDNNFIIDGATDNDAYYGETVVNDAGISGTPASSPAPRCHSGIQHSGAAHRRFWSQARRGREHGNQVRHETCFTAAPIISTATTPSMRATTSILRRNRLQPCC